MKRDAMTQASKDDLLGYLRTIPKLKLKIKDGKSLIELATYDDISMWWFADSNFNKDINQFVKSVSSGKVLINKKISVIDHMKKNSFLYFIYEFFTSFLYKLYIGLYNKRSYGENRILVVTASRYWRPTEDPFTKELKKGDSFFDSTISLLKKSDYEIITTSPFDFPISGLKIMVDKQRNQKDISHKPFNIYWSFNIWKKGKRAKKYFSNLWKSLKKDGKFEELLKYENINLDFLERRLCYYFTTVFERKIKYIEMAKQMLEKERPNLILMETEFANVQRALVIAGKLKGIPTLAIQHGYFTPVDKEYMYAKNEVSPEGSVKSPYCPIPDKTAVYGYYHKDLLTKMSAYPVDSVVVTGSPRYDSLYYADKIYNKNKIFKQLNLDLSKKMILWTAQTHGFPLDENEKNVLAVYDAVKSLKNVQLVIKLHLSEDQRAPVYKKDKYFKPMILSGKADTYALLYACDLMITRHSTTAMEAVALNKPVIVLNLSGEPDPVEYVKEGIALGVYKEEDLKPAIEQLLKDNSELAKNRENFIKKYLYKIDGKASERVVQLIKEMIKEEWKRDET
jgi:hypothetical protein